MNHEGRSILQDLGTLSMLKIWIGLEVRHFMSLSVKQVRFSIIFVIEAFLLWFSSKAFTNFIIADSRLGQNRSVVSQLLKIFTYILIIDTFLVLSFAIRRSTWF